MVGGSSVYRAAVVQFTPVTSNGQPVDRVQALAIMDTNLEAYARHAATAAAQFVDVLVFPEDGLFGPDFVDAAQVYPFLETLPPAGAGIVPCGSAHAAAKFPVLAKLSCIARAYKLTLVATVGEKVACGRRSAPGCKSTGFFQYNTAVALEADGALVAAYRKSHLWYEHQFTEAVPTPARFVSHFGVEFGMFICADLLYAQPQSMLRAAGVQNLLVPMWWVNTPPEIIATSAQLGLSQWAQANVIAANTGQSYLSSGSGIYSNGVALATHYNVSAPLGDDVMLVADVPVVPHGSADPVQTADGGHSLALAPRAAVSQRPGFFGRGVLPSSQAYVSRMVVPYNEPAGLVELSIGSLAKCIVSWSAMQAAENDTFLAYAYSGAYRLYEPSVCGLVVCPDPPLCEAFAYTSQTSFSAVAIQQTLANTSGPVFPTLLGRNLALSDSRDFNWSIEGETATLHWSPGISDPRVLVSALIYGLSWS